MFKTTVYPEASHEIKPKQAFTSLGTIAKEEDKTQDQAKNIPD